MNQPPKFPTTLIAVTLGSGFAFITFLYGYDGISAALERPVSGVLYALSYAALLLAVMPLLPQLYRSKKVFDRLEQSFKELMEHPEELLALSEASRYDKRERIVITDEELQYLWTPRAYLRHRRGKEATRLAGLLFLSFAFLLIDKALLGDHRTMLLFGLITLAVPIGIELLGVLFYREEAVRDHAQKRLKEERPWLFSD